MVCSKCGKELADGTGLCPECGVAVDGAPNAPSADSPEKSPKNWFITLVLCMLFGPLGVHRFYARRYLSGVIQLCTFGGLGFWALFDFIFILFGRFKDREGLPITRGGKRETVVRRPVQIVTTKRGKAIFCQECGTKVEPEMEVCPKCGWKPNDESSALPQNSAEYNEALEMAKTIEHVGVPLGGGVAAEAFFLSVGLGYYAIEENQSYWIFILVVPIIVVVVAFAMAVEARKVAQPLVEACDLENARPAVKKFKDWELLLEVGLGLFVVVPVIILFSIANWMIACVILMILGGIMGFFGYGMI